MTALRTGEALATGVTRRRLSGADWEWLSHGLYAPRGTSHRGNEVAAGLRKILPADGTFAHVTAAAIHGWPLPWLPEGLPTIAATARAVHVQREGVYVRRMRHLRTTSHEGLPVLDTTELLCDLARDFALVDLVPVVDAALRADELTSDQVRRRIRPRSKGRPRLLIALGLADPRAESYWESVLRLLHTMSGITQVQPQVWIPGESVRGDLWLVGTRRIVEYDGAEHRQRSRHQQDIRRDKTVRRAGWERFPYEAEEIRHNPGRILRDAEDALGLRHDPARLALWLEHARVSTLTGQGRARLEGRLAKYLTAGQGRDRSSGA